MFGRLDELIIACFDVRAAQLTCRQAYALVPADHILLSFHCQASDRRQAATDPDWWRHVGRLGRKQQPHLWPFPTRTFSSSLPRPPVQSSLASASLISFAISTLHFLNTTTPTSSPETPLLERPTHHQQLVSPSRALPISTSRYESRQQTWP